MRFPGFDGEWEKSSLGEIAKVSSGGTPNRANQSYWNGDIPWVTTSLINFSVIYKSAEMITEQGLKNSSAKLFPPGTILMAMYGQGKTRGQVALLNIEACTNQACAAIIVDSKIIGSQFLFQNLSKRYDEIRELSNQGGQENLSGSIIKGLSLNFPSLDEQTKIAYFLSVLDHRISTQSKIIQRLESLINGLSKNLFSQKSRFKDKNGHKFPDWQIKRLGAIASINTGSSNREDSILDGNYMFFDRSQDVRTSHKYLFDKEAIIVPGEGQEFLPKYYIGKFDLHQRTYAIFDFVGVKGRYLYYHIRNNDKHLQSQAVGSTVKSLRLPIFQSMPINLPESEEQTLISKFLVCIDEKILMEKKTLDLYKHQKKYFLQGMFI